VTSGGVIGVPMILPNTWRLVHGYLVGPWANVPNADLSHGNFANANLTGANFKNANLTQVNLDGATLTYATLTGVISSGIIGTPQSLPTGWRLVGGSLTHS